MPKKETNRTRRVADLIQAELANILLRESHGSDLSLATITEVSVSPDFSHAKIFVSVLDENNAKKVIEALNEESKNLRFLLAKRIVLRVIPDLKFVYDDTALHGQHISSLIDKALKDHK